MGENKMILVVDDDLDIREALAAVLESAGYTVQLAENGKAALEALGKGPLPSLILLDLMMPVMDGWQFREHQRESETLRSIPVVIISAGGKVEEKAENLDAAGWLRKPLTIPVLLAEVQRALSAPVPLTSAATGF
jgi:CheY-like chemotaxis protein